jgi:hypothetical protein
VIALVTLSTILNSCYKTGEIIYQRKCGVVSFNMQTDKLYNRDFLGAAPNTDINSAISYENIAGRRTNKVAEDLISPAQTSRHETEFYYDDNNNMNRMRWLNWEVLPPNTPYPPTAIVDNFIITYPSGTRNSVSNIFKIQRFREEIPEALDSPYTYTFNGELQLTSITDYYGNVRQTFEYDFAGNCTKNTIYGTNNTVKTLWEYLSYDDKINPCRTDRTLQLYYNIYSKNNPTSVRLTVYDDKGAVQTYNNTYIYTSNSDGYATGIVGFTKPYALYICPIP